METKKSKKKLKDKLDQLSESANSKIRKPYGDEFIGTVEKRVGGSRMKIRKKDGSECLAIIPGRLKKYLWIREGDVVLLKPWQIEKTKSDVIYKYTKNEIRKLQTIGIIDDVGTIEEF